MAKVQFSTAKGPDRLARSPFYIGIPQHERTMGKKESYAYLSDRIGYKGTAIRAVFMGLADYAKENADKGNITQIDGVASIRNICRGPFEGLGGPWVKGKNLLVVAAVSLDPFKSVLSGIVPVNRTDGAKPVINTVLDETTMEYGEITGTDLFSIAGADLGPDSEKADEYVGLFKNDVLVAKATIISSELNTIECKFEGVSLDPGEYRIGVFTRCGDSDEEVSVKSTYRTVTVALAA